MFGLAVLGALLLYLLVSLVVIIGVTVWAGRHKRNRLGWGLGAAFVMYNLVFWDWLPTVYVHKYYCEKEAGFWVYKTMEQWKTENPRVMEGLVANKVSIQTVGDDANHTDTQVLNQRFQWITEKQNLIPHLPIYRWRSQVVDVSHGEAVARWIDFSSGTGRDYLKFWMNAESCPDGIANRKNLFHFADELIKMTDTTKRSAK